MAEQDVVQTQDTQTTDTTTQTQQQQVAVNPFQDNNWTETAPTLKVDMEGKLAGDTATTTTTNDTTTSDTATDDTVVVEPDAFLKEQLGYDNWAAAKEDIARLKATAQTPAEIKFANEQSQKLFEYLKEGKEDEVYSLLDTKKKLSAVDNMDASSVIKLAIQQNNKHYKSQDVEDVFEEQYPFTPKPTLQDGEETEDYQARLNTWQAATDKINRKIERDAFAAKEQLKKLNSELVLPDIKRNDPAQEQAIQKELEKQQQAKVNYLSKLESDFTKVNGYNATFKDETIEIPIAYVIPDNEKAALKEDLKNFNINTYFAERWFDKDGNPKIEQIGADKYLLDNPGKVFQKFAQDAGAKRLAHYLAQKHNVDLKGTQSQTTFKPDGGKEATRENEIKAIWKEG